MGNKLLEVGPLELEVVGVLNSAGELSVAQIRSSLDEAGHELAYTTVMTVLVRLHKKGIVSRRKEGRQFLYATAKRKDSTPQNIFERVKKSLFGSEKLRPILGLLESDDGLTREELEELKRAVEARLGKRARS